MQNDVILTAGVRLDPASESQLQQSFARIEKSMKFNTPFAAGGRNVRDFSSELDRANQRVITLGASFAVLSTSIRIFKDIITSTVAVEKALMDINSVLQLSTANLDNFSRGLFNVARETGQSFEKAAEAAKEFSRQGLGMQETLTRTRDAMVLTRLASLSTEEAVQTLTAAVNGFQKAGLTTTEIVNKLATVDAKFAVSSKDLAQGLARAGAVASDAGVEFDKLIGIITSAQQTTARGGAVIGNAIKTIFTRIERRDTLETLEGLGVAVTDAAGRALSAEKVLLNFANVYDKLGASVKKGAAELVAGGYQINILKAIMSDLQTGSESVSERASKTSAAAANEAIKRNEALNKSLSALAQQAQTTYQQVGSKVGDLGIGNAAKGLLSGFTGNTVVQALANAGESETNSAGEKLAAGVIKGFGSALVFGLGPAIVVALASIALKTVQNVQKDFAAALDIRKMGKVQAETQQQIVSLYNSGDDALKRQIMSMGTLAERAALVEGILSRTARLQSGFQADTSALAGAVINLRKTPRAADGYDPFSAEASAIRAGVGGASPSARPVMIPNFAFGGGRIGPIVANTSEYMVKTPNGSAIYNPEMIQRRGLPPGSTPIAAGGYMPGGAPSKYVQNIINAYRSSFNQSDSVRFNQAERATTYYPTVNQEIKDLSFKSGRTPEQLAYGLAALSANARDSDARMSLASLAMGGGAVGAIPQTNALKALRIFGATSREEMVNLLGGGAKTQNFAPSLLLENSFSGFGKFKSKIGTPAVMDSWAIYVRNGGAAAETYNRDAVSEEQKKLLFDQSKRGYGYYNRLSSEYQEASKILGVSIPELQGRTWGWARGQPGSKTRTFASGYDPLSMESKAIQSGVGGADSSASPVYLPNFARGGGQMGIVANTSEFIVPTPSGKAIYTREMAGKFGLPSGAVPVAAGGYIPNMAKGGNPYSLPPEWGSSDYYKGLGKPPEAYGPAAPTSAQWEEMEKERSRVLANLFAKEKAETEKQLAIEEKRTKLKEKLFDAEQKKIAKQEARWAKQAERDVAKQAKINDLYREAESINMEKAKEALLPIVQRVAAKAAVDAIPVAQNFYTTPEAQSMSSVRSSMGYMDKQARMIRMSTPHETTFVEKGLSKNLYGLSNIQLGKLGDITGGMSGFSRDEMVQSLRGEFSAKPTDSDRIKTMVGLSRSGTLQSNFSDQAKWAVDKGDSLESAMKYASDQFIVSGGSMKQLARTQVKLVGGLVEYEKGLAEQKTLLAEEKAVRVRNLQIASVQNRAGINLQASQNQIGSILQSEGIDALSQRQKAIYMASVRREEAQKLGFQNSNIGGNKLAKEQIDAAVASRLAESPKFGLTPAAPSRFGKVGEFFKGNPLAASLGASMGLSFAGGALPSLFSEERQRGGTASGMGIGIASSALTGAGVGAGIGSFVPGGIVPGIAIGALIGGIKGSFDKLETSFEEIAETLNRVNEKVRKNLESATEVRMAQAEITGLKSEGGSPREIEVANKKLRSALARMNVAPEILAGMMGTQEQQREAQIALERKSSDRIDLSTMLSASKGAATATGFFDMGDKEITKSRQSMASAFSSLFKDKTMEEVQTIREQVKTDPSYLRKALKGAGASETEIEESLPAQNKAAKAPWYTYMTGIPSLIGAYQEKKGSQFGDLAMGGMLDALDKAYENARMANLSGEKTSKNAEDRKILIGKVEGYRQKEEFGRITYDADRSIFDTNRQIAMSRDNLSEPKKIEMQGDYLRKSISNELEMKRSSLLTGAQGSLIGLAKDKGVSGSFVKDVESISDVSGIKDLLEILTDPKMLESKGYGSTANKEMIDALLGTKRAMEAADKAAKEQTRAVDANTKSLNDEYIRTGTRAAATESYGSAVGNLEDALKRAETRNDTPDIIRSLETALELAKVGARYQAGGSAGAFEKGVLGTQLLTSRKSEITNIEAIRRLARSKNPEESSLISGDMLGAAEFRDAKLKGQGGDFMGSLSGGFSSVFVKMKKDMNDLSELGASLGQSLSANLSGAFGDFVTGAKSGKDAFRSFAVSVLGDASRMFASQAIQGILGSIFGGMTGATGTSIGTAKAMPFAAGGKVPAMLTGGEYYIGPKAAKSIGYDTLHRLNKYADGGMVRGGSGVKDDVPAKLAPGSFIIKKSAVGKLGPDYLDSLVGGKVQHRFFGGLLMGAVMGGALGYATGGKKGAIAGAIIGGIGGGLAQNYSQTGSMFRSDAGAGMFQFSPSAASGPQLSFNAMEGVQTGSAAQSLLGNGAKAAMPMWQKAALGLGASALLGGVSSMLAPKDPTFTPMNSAQITENRKRMEAEKNGMSGPAGLYPWLSANPNGGSNMMGYVLPPTRRMYADGGMVGGTAPLFMSEGGPVGVMGSVEGNRMPSGGGPSTSNVNIKIDINNNGSTSASASSDNKDGQGGFGANFAEKLQKQVQGIVQQELVNQSRSDGFFTQKGRFVQGR